MRLHGLIVAGACIAATWALAQTAAKPDAPAAAAAPSSPAATPTGPAGVPADAGTKK